MAAAETAQSWHEIVLNTLKRNDVRLVPYVPDRVLTALIKNLHADPFFNVFPTAREEEAVGIVSGAWMGGMRGAMLMQTSGFATLANVLASLVVPSQIPLIMFVSERGTLGEFNLGQLQITGSQPTPAAASADLVAIAIASGLSSSSWAADEEDFERLIEQSLVTDGPTLIGVRIDDKPGTGTTRRDPVQIRERFMHGLGVRQPL
jgi:sulfopyruvate decarboxylase TPP-binding subunit